MLIVVAMLLAALVNNTSDAYVPPPKPVSPLCEHTLYTKDSGINHMQLMYNSVEGKPADTVMVCIQTMDPVVQEG